MEQLSREISYYYIMDTYKELLAAYGKVKSGEISEDAYRKLVQEFQFEAYDSGYKDASRNDATVNE